MHQYQKKPLEPMPRSIPKYVKLLLEKISVITLILLDPLHFGRY